MGRSKLCPSLDVRCRPAGCLDGRFKQGRQGVFMAVGCLALSGGAFPSSSERPASAVRRWRCPAPSSSTASALRYQPRAMDDPLKEVGGDAKGRQGTMWRRRFGWPGHWAPSPSCMAALRSSCSLAVSVSPPGAAFVSAVRAPLLAALGSRLCPVAASPRRNGRSSTPASAP